MDVPVKSFHAPNEGAEPRIANPNHFIRRDGSTVRIPDAQLCGLSNFETALIEGAAEEDVQEPEGVLSKVARRYDELVKEGWALEVYRGMVLAEAARVTF